ncbi:aminotransferase class I/II-fold pyridoxal phosphate-dependent enzyme [Paenibacillus sp.]|uniref:trans-sulfuration enzyme family protein n=1 Tax=Paenibacillus sp. TaxID=58172 RepID=UPI00281206B6|nr:aminotransferase class I/II-fold pyridoxal phosphate-dependent enzyme [Paenibacillus sp.]
MTNRDEERHIQTLVAHDPVDTRHHGAVTMPLYQNSLFAFENHASFDCAMKDVLAAHVYSRGNNPTVMYLERRIAELEGGEQARCFASGMGAIAGTLHALLQTGDHIVCVDQAYGPTREFLADLSTRYRVEVTFVDGSELDAFRQAVRPNTKVIYLESPTSGLFELQDLEGVAAIAREAGALTVIDNSWATPVFQRPISMGIDLVVHSLTKYFSGHSDSLGGVVVGRRDLIETISNRSYMLLGSVMTAHTASLITRGVRTLPLRMERHQASGLRVAEHLLRKGDVVRVNHPGLPTHPQRGLAEKQLQGYGSLFSFVTRHPVDSLKAWADDLEYFRIGVSWGGYESLVTVGAAPARWNQGGESPSIARLYIGLEDPDVLIGDIERAWSRLVRD